VLDILSGKLSRRCPPLAHAAPHLSAVGCLRDEQRVLGQKAIPSRIAAKRGNQPCKARSYSADGRLAPWCRSLRKGTKSRSVW
jgi:hypothetical protein